MVSCGGPEYQTSYYKAVSADQKDTALLKLLTSETAFYGNYQIKYDDKSIDDGSISGHINGDTLIGKFSYLSRDRVKSTRPIAFLKTGEKLRLGTGKTGTYMGLNVYLFGSVTFTDSLLQFHPIEERELVALRDTVR